MNKFALGVITTMLLTTKEGNSVLKMGAKVGNKLLTQKLGIDLKELLTDESEVIEDDTQRDDA